jgi:hypothetical protein
MQCACMLVPGALFCLRFKVKHFHIQISDTFPYSPVRAHFKIKIYLVTYKNVTIDLQCTSKKLYACFQNVSVSVSVREIYTPHLFFSKRAITKT